MNYTAPALAQMSQTCAPQIATQALLPLIQVESGGDPLRINVNHGPRVWVRSVAAGAELVRRYVARGYSVDVGLAQIDSRNFARLGLSVEAAFDPCTNLQAAAKVLQDGYAQATLTYAGMDAISATYSLYNTGTLSRGLRNGYVGRVWEAASGLLASGQLTQGFAAAAIGPIPDASTLPAEPEPAPSPSATPPKADWVMGETQTAAVVVFK